MNAKILIADDESDIVSMLGNFFESKGFRVLPAFNGAEALKQALFISPKKPCSLCNRLCCTRSLSIRNDFFDL